MLLLPTGSDDRAGTRRPLMSAALVTSLFLGFGVTHPRVRAEKAESRRLTQSLVEQWAEHPWAVLPPGALAALPRSVRQRYARSREELAVFEADPAAALQALGPWSSPADPEATGAVPALLRDRAARDELQHAVDLAATRLSSERSNSLLGHFGWAPARPAPSGLLGYSWLHGGWLHLLLNALFLWAAGASIEAIWGPARLLAVFVFGGLCGALGYALLEPDTAIPMIGASAAVAALLGAHFVRLQSHGLRFFYAFWLGRCRWGSFSVPARVLIPLWLLTELASTLLLDVPQPAAAAHIAGFFGGAVPALIGRWRR